MLVRLSVGRRPRWSHRRTTSVPESNAATSVRTDISTDTSSGRSSVSPARTLHRRLPNCCADTVAVGEVQFHGLEPRDPAAGSQQAALFRSVLRVTVRSTAMSRRIPRRKSSRSCRESACPSRTRERFGPVQVQCHRRLRDVVEDVALADRPACPPDVHPRAVLRRVGSKSCVRQSRPCRRRDSRRRPRKTRHSLR